MYKRKERKKNSYLLPYKLRRAKIDKTTYIFHVKGFCGWHVVMADLEDLLCIHLSKLVMFLFIVFSLDDMYR